MKRISFIIGLITFFALALPQGEAAAGAPAGFLHLDAKAGCVFGNAPHHWFKKVNDDLYFGLVFESDDDDAQPVAIELVATKAGYEKLPKNVKKHYHNHADEVARGDIALPGMKPEDAKKTLEFLATTYGRMILISEVAGHAAIEQTQIPAGHK